VHRDSRYFSPDPEKFIPERWLADEAMTKERNFKLEKEAYIPFSYGVWPISRISL
jgi:cytochrome P450